MDTTTIGLCVWALSAVLVGYNAWDLCKRQHTADNETLWKHVGYYRYPSTKHIGYDKIAPLYYNPDSTSAVRWGYPLDGQVVYPTSAAVRRRGVGFNDTPLPLVEKA
jgi:hypothetical protein